MAIFIILVPVIISLSLILILYPFEWVASSLANANILFHLLFWFLFLGVFIGFISFLSFLIGRLASFLVRQTFAYGILVLVFYLIVIGYYIYGTWTDMIVFSWEEYGFVTLNKVIFTICLLVLFSTPMIITVSSED